MTDIAWAAGFFDGEGCIQILNNKGKNKTNSYYVTLDVSQAYSKEPLLLLQRLFGGSLEVLSARKHCPNAVWHWRLYAKDAIREMLVEMLPYLTVKRRQATTAISFLDFKATTLRLRSPWRLSRLQWYKEKIRILKRTAA